MGKHIDIVAGLYDDNFVSEHECEVEYLFDKPLLLAVPLTHTLNGKSEIGMDDLRGGKVMLIRKNWNRYIDKLREDLIKNDVEIEEFNMFNISAFNQAVNENIPIITVEGWEDVHPLLKIIPAKWEYKIPFGIFYSPTPTKQVKNFIKIICEIYSKE